MVQEMFNLITKKEHGYFLSFYMEYKKFVNGYFNKRVFHREDGPAIITPEGNMLWFYKGKKINCSSQREFEKLIALKAFW